MQLALLSIFQFKKGVNDYDMMTIIITQVLRRQKIRLKVVALANLRDSGNSMQIYFYSGAYSIKIYTFILVVAQVH